LIYAAGIVSLYQSVFASMHRLVQQSGNIVLFWQQLSALRVMSRRIRTLQSKNEVQLWPARIGGEICEKELVPRRLGASAGRLDGYKDRIDLRQNLRIFETENPAVLLLIIDLEQSETVRCSLSWSALPPNLERCISLGGVSVVQIKRVKNERRFSL